MKIAILGFGREGQSILRYLKRNNKNAEVWILDVNPQIKIPRGARAVLGANYLDNLADFDVVFRSPGIPYNLPQIQRAIKKGVKFFSSTQLFFEKCPCKIIGVTGTKGKGTTASLIFAILKKKFQITNHKFQTNSKSKISNFKQRVFLVGNIEKPCLDILPKLNKNSIVVFELSSFQLWDLDASPQIAVVLGIFPDHLDKHKSFKEYFEAKANIAKYQKAGDKVFYFADEKYSRQIAEMSRGKKIAVKYPHPSPCLPDRQALLAKERENIRLRIMGPHNLRNAMMAAIVAKDLGVDEKIVRKTIENFRGLPHRLQFVKKINGVAYYNDSASTNPESTAMAIQSFNELVILIAGGKDKGLNYAPFAKALKESTVKIVLLFGENKNKIKKQIQGLVKIELCENLQIAIEKAVKMAYSGDIILFSPGSASFDMFKDYKDRGEQFKKSVLTL